jgi:hypothetical protein
LAGIPARAAGAGATSTTGAATVAARVAGVDLSAAAAIAAVASSVHDAAAGAASVGVRDGRVLGSDPEIQVRSPAASDQHENNNRDAQQRARDSRQPQPSHKQPD